MKTFEHNGKKYTVVSPNLNVDTEAKKIYMAEYNKALKAGSVPRDRLDDKLKDLGILSEADYAKMEKIRDEIDELLKPLKTGKIKLKEMKDRAVKAQSLRLQLYGLISYRTKYDDMCAESIAEDARFNYFVYACLIDESHKRVFNTLDDWNACTDSELLSKAANTMGEILYPDRSNIFNSLPENEFLVKYGFYTKDLVPVDAPKEPEFEPFLDEDDKPVEIPVVTTI